jgi:hypothetical protein
MLDMKTFYCVMIEKYADGRVKAAVAERKCRNMPKNQTRRLPGVDASTTWYEDINQATVVLEEVKKEIAA